WSWLARAPVKVFWLYYTDTSGLYEAVLDAPETTPSPVAAWVKEHQHVTESLTYRYYAAVMLLASLGLFCAPAGTRHRALSLLALPCLLIGFHLFFHAKDRFHVPLAPFLAILAALTAVQLFDAITRLRVRPSRSGSPRDP